ncbi:MAG: hypothetical protein LBH26_02015 [Treponema sp.]|nr:hypothetical protein [Treponema sp.]
MGRSRALCFCLLFLCGAPLAVKAQYLKPFALLRVIETDHFEIIYPPESEETARSLAAFADGAYRRISGLLGISLGRKVPVTLIPHTDEYNGYMNIVPYPHIILLDTPIDAGWTIFSNSLEGLFFHELAHGLSLSSRGAFFETLHRIFGGWVYPTELTAPLFMIEGAAVSFESLDGAGRANDPLARQKVRQDIYENKFLSPFQASGVSNEPEARGAYYEYGGLFSRYLQENYGMDKYALLWQSMGKSVRLSLFFYKHGFYNAFQKIYGLDLRDVWEDFRKSLVLENIENNSSGLVRKGLPLKFPGAYTRINGLAAAGGRIFMLDGSGREAAVYNPAGGKTEKRIPMGINAYDITASANGERVLVSSYSRNGQRAEAAVTEYRVKSGLPLRVWKDLYRGSYFRDGVVGLSSDRHINLIVFRSGTGRKDSRNETVLLRGSAELALSDPRPLDDTWIAFIAGRRGRRELCLYNFDTRRIYRAVSDLEDDGERWRYIRYLQVSGGKLLFAYNHDDRMYKLGVADPSGLTPSGEGSVLQALFAGRDFSGAVSMPVMTEGSIYYRGAFSRESRLMRYPEAETALTGRRAALRLELWDPAPPEERAPGRAEALTEAGGSRGAARPGGAAGETPPGKLYFPLKYYNPLLFWLPLPLVKDTRDGLSLEGGGVLSFLMDPAELNQVFLRALADVPSKMADTELIWTNQTLGFPLRFFFKDGVDKTEYRDLRITEISLTGAFSRGLDIAGLSIGLMPGFHVSFSAWDDLRGFGAYSWKYNGKPAYTFQLGTVISNLYRFSWETFGRGFQLDNYARLAVHDQSFEKEYRYPGYSGMLRMAFEPFFPARLGFYGAWDEFGVNLKGHSAAALIFADLAPSEYHSVYFNRLKWLAGAEAESLLFSLKIQHHLSHLYLNRIFGTVAYRAALYDGSSVSYPRGEALGEKLRLTQSLIFRFNLDTASIFVTSIPVRFTPVFLIGFRLTNDRSGPDPQSLLWFNFSYKLEY